jgi:hypothetical protein
VKLAPGAAVFCLVLTDLPLTFAEYFKPRGIEYEMFNSMRMLPELDFKASSPPGKLRVMRRSQIDSHHLENGADEALSLPKRQMKDFTKSEAAENCGIGIGIRPASTARLAMIEPLVERMRIKPYGEATAICKGGVILFPVTGAVLGFGFLVLHKIRIPSQPHP